MKTNLKHMCKLSEFDLDVKKLKVSMKSRRKRRLIMTFLVPCNA